jgi:hypothetical protein
MLARFYVQISNRSVIGSNGIQSSPCPTLNVSLFDPNGEDSGIPTDKIARSEWGRQHEPFWQGSRFDTGGN